MAAVKKILFIGTRQIGVWCLEHLLASIKGTDCEIIGVLTTPAVPQWWSPECPKDVWQVALEHGLPLLQEEQLLQLDYDMLFCVTYLKIFPAQVVARARCHAINLHPGPVPDYRGFWSCSFALINGDSEFGVSLHVMDAGIDAGPIIDVDYFPIAPDETCRSLYDKTLAAGFALFKRYLPQLLDGSFTSMPQADYARLHNKPDRCYYNKSLTPYLEGSVAVPDAATRDRIKRALTFPPRFPLPAWLQD